MKWPESVTTVLGAVFRAVMTLGLVVVVILANGGSAMAKGKLVRAVPIGGKVKPIVAQKFGNRVSFAIDMPTGLFKDGYLTYPEGTVQTIFFYGALSEEEIAQLADAVSVALSEFVDPEVQYAALHLKFFRAQEAILDSETGISTMHDKDYLGAMELKFGR